VEEIFDMESAMQVMNELFSTQKDAVEAPKLRMKFPTGNLMIQAGAIPHKGYYGYKVYGRAGALGIGYVVHLYDINTGDLLAIVDSDTLTVRRTGAQSGIASEHMSKLLSKKCGVIGSGYQAMAALASIAQVRHLELVRIYSRSSDNRGKFAKSAEKTLDLAVEAVETALRAVKDCDILVLATSSRSMTPLISGDWLEEGCHVNGIGAVGRGRIELDVRTFERCARVAVDSVEECVTGSEEVISALDKGSLKKSDLIPIGEILNGRVKGRLNDKEITLFKSQGSGLQDVMCAAWIYEKARKMNKGKEIPEMGIKRRF
jgi:ornithine cyclodeaminase/alanine dehydrogenase-like protein (mu-crystallin family)